MGQYEVKVTRVSSLTFGLPSGLRGQLVLLVAAILTIQLSLFGLLEFILKQAEAEAAHIEKTRSIVSASNRLYEQLFVMQSAGSGYITTRSARALLDTRAAMKEATETQEWLEAQLSGPGEQGKLIRKIGRELSQTISRANQILAESAGKNTDLFSVGQEIGSLRRMAEQLNIDILEFQKQQRQIEIQSPELAQRARQRVNALIVGGCLLNAILAIGLAIFLSRRIVDRLDILSQNATRLSTDAPLLPLAPGRDEIANLDIVFHKMARQIKDEQTLLKASEARVRLIIERMPVGIVVLDEQGNIEFVNPRLLMFSGFAREDLVGRPLGILFREKNSTSESEVDTIKRLRERGTNKTFEVPLFTINGNRRQVEFSMGALSSQEGAKELAAITDVTERYEIQQMRQAFVSMVSHDLRTPLTGVRGFLNLIVIGALGELSDQVRDGAAAAEQSVNRLIELVNDLLRLEKLESGVIDLKRQPILLSKVINEALDSVKVIAATKKIAVEFKDETRTPANIDVMRILQVIVNLTANAVKFSPEHSLVVVSASESDSGHEISVTDQGPGIAQEHQTAIFDRFQQVSEEKTVSKEGFGLGLAICKTIVEQHSGTIGVRSQEGKGSCFWVELNAS